MAARPKSTIQISPGLTAGIFVLHPVEHSRSLHGRLIAKGNGFVFLRQFEQPLTHCAPFRLGQFGEFV